MHAAVQHVVVVVGGGGLGGGVLLEGGGLAALEATPAFALALFNIEVLSVLVMSAPAIIRYRLGRS